MFSKIIVGLVLVLNIAFTVAILIIFTRTGTEPPTLIAAWFAFTTTELAALAGIKICKIRKGGKNDKLEKETIE